MVNNTDAKCTECRHGDCGLIQKERGHELEQDDCHQNYGCKKAQSREVESLECNWDNNRRRRTISNDSSRCACRSCRIRATIRPI